MTSIGLIARADSRGLGIQTKAFHDNMRPAKTMVVDCPSAHPLPLRRNWYPDATWISGIPDRADVAAFLDGVDVVYTAETAYTPHVWREAQQRGVRTLLHANYEFLDRRDQPTQWLAPSPWHLHDFPDGTIHLPVPIETDKFPTTPKPSTAKRFLHIVGRPAIHDRNGTLDVLSALRHVTSRIEVTITCQHPGYVGRLINDHAIRTPSNVTLTIKPGDTENYWDHYTGFDALILPRRFGGLSLPCNEGIGAGIPVIMPNIEPNTTYLPKEWLVPATLKGEFDAKQRINFYQTPAEGLAERIDQLATDPNFYRHTTTQAEKLKQQLAWNTLKPRYMKVLG